LDPEIVYAEKVNQLEPKMVSLLESVGEAVPFPLVAVKDFGFGADDDFIYTVTRVMGESMVLRSEVVTSRLRLPKGSLGVGCQKRPFSGRLAPHYTADLSNLPSNSHVLPEQVRRKQRHLYDLQG